MHPPQRCFLLQQFDDPNELPLLKQNKDGDRVFAHYISLIADRVAKTVAAATVEYRATESGPLIFIFASEFPSSELPFNGGIEEFSFEGFEYQFDSFGANAIRTLVDAEDLHEKGICKPLLCLNHTCFNYCGALDEFTFVPPLAFFARQCPKMTAGVETNVCDILDGDQVYDAAGEGAEPLCTVARATPVLLDEYVVELESPPDSLLNGEVVINDARWELLPIPSDASRLDMHLAQISSLDAKYAKRFTREIRYMDEYKEPQQSSMSTQIQRDGDDVDADGQLSFYESDSDPESYVESALIPGLRHRDFSKPISTTKALGGLTLDEKTQQRLTEVLNS